MTEIDSYIEDNRIDGGLYFRTMKAAVLYSVKHPDSTAIYDYNFIINGKIVSSIRFFKTPDD
tara:strand:+ start:473 stop:658 length:186 start_codon:yes stop_codon:yes gene_type:complete